LSEYFLIVGWDLGSICGRREHHRRGTTVSRNPEPVHGSEPFAIARAEAAAGNHGIAVDLFQTLWEEAIEANDVQRAVTIAFELGASALEIGDDSIASHAFEYAQKHLPRSDAGQLADAWIGIARAALMRGDVQSAIGALGLAEIPIDLIADNTRKATALHWLGFCHLNTGEPGIAIQELRQAIALMEESGPEALRGSMFATLSAALLASGQLDDAASQFIAAHRAALAAGDLWNEFTALRGLGKVAAAEGFQVQANDLRRRAGAVFGGRIDDIERAELFATLAVALRDLGDEAGAAAAERTARAAVLAVALPASAFPSIFSAGAWILGTASSVRGTIASTQEYDVSDPKRAMIWFEAFREIAYLDILDGRDDKARFLIGMTERIKDQHQSNWSIAPAKEEELLRFGKRDDPMFLEGWRSVIVVAEPESNVRRSGSSADRQSEWKAVFKAELRRASNPSEENAEHAKRVKYLNKSRAFAAIRNRKRLKEVLAWAMLDKSIEQIADAIPVEPESVRRYIRLIRQEFAGRAFYELVAIAKNEYS
jgi:hypothetical protein